MAAASVISNGDGIRIRPTPPICVDYAFLLREANGDVRAVHDRHIEGLFPRAAWLDAFASAGLSVNSDLDAWGRDVFLATPKR
jgi:hypothetical protein